MNIDEISDEEVNVWIKKHKRFKRNSIFGIVIWMCAIFWLPFLIGCFIQLDYNIKYKTFDLIFCNGLSAMMWAQFTSPVTLPLLTCFGAFVRPHIIKKFIFTKKYPYNESVLKDLGWDKTTRIMCGGTAIAGTLLKNKNNFNNNSDINIQNCPNSHIAKNSVVSENNFIDYNLYINK